MFILTIIAMVFWFSICFITDMEHDEVEKMFDY